MSKRKLDRRPKARDLPPRQPERHPEPEPAEPTEPETTPPQQAQLLAIPTLIPEAPIQCEGPETIAGKRLTRVQELASEAIRLIIQDITEELTNNPSAAMYETSLVQLPDDVINVVVASMFGAGWKIFTRDKKNIAIELPTVPIIAPEVMLGSPSSVQPL